MLMRRAANVVEGVASPMRNRLLPMLIVPFVIALPDEIVTVLVTFTPNTEKDRHRVARA